MPTTLSSCSLVAPIFTATAKPWDSQVHYGIRPLDPWMLSKEGSLQGAHEQVMTHLHDLRGVVSNHVCSQDLACVCVYDKLQATGEVAYKV